MKTSKEKISLTSMTLLKFLFLCCAGCLSWSSLAQEQLIRPISISAGAGIFSNLYLKQQTKSLVNRNGTDVGDYTKFPAVWQANISVQIHKEIRAVGLYTYELISDEKYRQGALIGAQYLYHVSEPFRVYASLAAGVSVVSTQENNVHFGYATTTAGVQYGRQFYIDLGFGGGMSGLLALKVGWLMPALKSKTSQK